MKHHFRHKESLEMYTCANCKNTFEKGWSDGEAEKETYKLFGVRQAASNEEMAVVCDDCFNKMREKGLF